ncbi:hypothetical protein C2U69_33850 [Cupriavidus pinatubonensis]|nr:hypothetical protein C2U69_33850 [Cupriavidus pinatubonensis]
MSGWANRCVQELLSHAGRLDEKLDEYDRAIREIAREDERSKRLMQLRGWDRLRLERALSFLHITVKATYSDGPVEFKEFRRVNVRSVTVSIPIAD